MMVDKVSLADCWFDTCVIFSNIWEGGGAVGWLEHIVLGQLSPTNIGYGEPTGQAAQQHSWVNIPTNGDKLSGW